MGLDSRLTRTYLQPQLSPVYHSALVQSLLPLSLHRSPNIPFHPASFVNKPIGKFDCLCVLPLPPLLALTVHSGQNIDPVHTELDLETAPNPASVQKAITSQGMLLGQHDKILCSYRE